MQFSIVNSDAGFRELRESWNRLAEPIPFQRWEWAYGWWEAFKNTRRELFIVTARDEAKQLLGLLPFYTESTVKHGRTLQLLGTGKACGDYLDLLTPDTAVDAVCKGLSNWLLSAEPAYRWDTISLDGIRLNDSNVECLAHRLQNQGCAIDYRPLVSSWRLRLVDTWEAYLKSLSKRTRRTLRTLERTYIASGRATVEVAAGHDGICEKLPLLEDMHEQRRQQLGSSGCYAVAGFREFVEKLAELEDAQNSLQLRILQVDGRPVAACLGFEYDSCFFVYQAGFYPSESQMKPGWILNAMLIQEGIQRGCASVDFLRGDERYKESLGAEPISLTRLEVVAPTSAAQLRRSIRKTGSTLKQFGEWWAVPTNKSTPGTS